MLHRIFYFMLQSTVWPQKIILTNMFHQKQQNIFSDTRLDVQQVNYNLS